MKSKTILQLFLAAFLILAAIDIFSSQLSFADSLSVSALIIFALITNTKYKISPTVAFSYCMIFVPNVLGHFGGYSLAILNYHYDWIVHTIAPIFAVFAVAAFLYENKISIKPIVSAAVAFFVVVSAGSAVEISEYWGFYFIGLGSGYLGFGTGDNSSNFGPWENSSIDMSFNILGSLLGAGMYLVYASKNYPTNADFTKRRIKKR